MKNIGILMGGTSAEREVSLNTGKNVFEALKKSKKYKAIPIEIRKDRTWMVLDDNLTKSGEVKIFGDNIATDQGILDGIFIALHGKGGEDGEIQGFLETIGIPYTGSGVLSSSIGMDKDAFKKILTFHQIPQAKYITITKSELNEKIIEEVLQTFPKSVVKPNAEGSSLGVSIVKEDKDFKAALSEAFKYDEKIIIEEYVEGRELSCGVLGNDELTALPSIEIKTKNEFFDYEAKYVEGLSEEICPAEITKEDEEKIKKISIDTFRALNCKGVARVDVFLKEDGEVLVIEINTLPGLTSTSLLPKEAAADGISFEQLIEKIIDYSF